MHSTPPHWKLKGDGCLAPGRVYGSASGERCWGQSSRGWSSGRCTVGFRLLTPRFDLRVGLCTTRIAGQHVNETDMLVPLHCLALLSMNDQGWLAGQLPPGFVSHLRVCSSQDVVLQREDDPQWRVGSTVWLQLDADTGEGRLQLDEEDLGVIFVLPLPLVGPVFPTFTVSLEDGHGGGDVMELL